MKTSPSQSRKGRRRSAGGSKRYRLIERYRISAPGPSTPARVLSGGNLQKVVLARELSGEPRVIVAASPTQGLDVGATESVRSYLHQAAVSGAAVR